MVSDPYKVLGVERGASQDEIKRAYRKKAKECHPDLHPDDPDARRKMQEANEAYDMLMNPDKYQNRQQYQGNPYGGQSGPYGGYGNPYGQQGWGGWQSGGWSDFEDMFGYGRQSRQTPPPREEPGDSDAVRQAVRMINMGQYQNALNLLAGVPVGGRNARWHYLGGMAYVGLGNTAAAMEQLQRAVQLEPGNLMYRQLYDRLCSAGQAYAQNARGYSSTVLDPQKLCMGLCLMQMFCRCFWCC